jgi:hypothetical protein
MVGQRRGTRAAGAGLVLGSVLAIACSDAATPGDDSSGGSSTAGSMSGAGVTSSGATTGSGGNAALAGASAQAGSSSSGGSGGGTAGADTGGGGLVDCASAEADACPMATGIEYACKQRFALGLNYAWRNFGADFGGLAAWNIQGVSAASAGYLADLTAMKSNGASLIRWWMFPDFRGDGVQFDAADDPSSVSDTAKADLQKALELAAQADVYLVPTLFSFDAFRPTTTTEGVLIRGVSSIVSTPARRAKLISNVVLPLAQAAAQSPHAARLIGWDVINEPEWAIEPTGQNEQDFDPNDELTAVSLADMKALIAEAAAVLEQQTPHAFTSVGWAAAKWAWAFNDVTLDVNQPHIYGWVNQYWPYTQTPAQLGYPARPTIMGEFYLEAMPFSDGGADATIGAILESWFVSGYAGAWPWQHFDKAANLPLLKTFADAKGCQVAF